MEKHEGMLEALEAYQSHTQRRFNMPSNNGRFINAQFKAIHDERNLYEIESNGHALFAQV